MILVTYSRRDTQELCQRLFWDIEEADTYLHIRTHLLLNRDEVVIKDAVDLCRSCIYADIVVWFAGENDAVNNPEFYGTR